MTFRRKVCMAVLLACASACSQNTPPPEPAAFSRPTRVAFVCVDKSKVVDDPQYLVELSRCDTRTTQAVLNPPDVGTAQYSLHALVTQSSRGEVAAVEVGTRHIVDSRLDIPGATFLPAGEVPIAIAVAKGFPDTFYVATAGSRDISVLRTNALFRAQGAESFRKQRLPLQLSEADAPAVPFDMLMSPDQDALFVSSADAGWVARIPIIRCTDSSDASCVEGSLGAAQRIAVEGSWAKLPEAAFVQQPTVDEAYRFTCSVPNQPSLLPTRDVPIPLPERGSDVGSPQPAGLALDAFCEPGNCTRRLLVADRKQPIVHAIDLDRMSAGETDAAVLEPILAGAPTERVAVTPRVPISRETTDATQYVYAIDARDGSVLVAQDGRIRNVSVDPNHRADRLDLGIAYAAGQPVALSLEVLTPNFDPFDTADQWVDREPLPSGKPNPLVCVDQNHQGRTVRRLRGVFLAVGSTDGTVRVFNVHDMELKNCRDNTCMVKVNDTANAAAYSPYNSGYDPYPVVRNRARIAIDYNTTTAQELQPLHPTVIPQFQVAGSIIGVKADGTTNDTRAAGLDCLPCSATQASAFPGPNDTTTATPAAAPMTSVTTQPRLATAGKAGSGAVAQDAMAMGDAGTASDAATTSTGGTCKAGEARVCVMADPFVEPLSWNVVYEGHLPGTNGGRGRFVGPEASDSGALEFLGETGFCKAGVLGDDVLGSAAFPGEGDQLQILSALPTPELRARVQADAGLAAVENDACNRLISARDTENKPIAFAIQKAYADRLQIKPDVLGADETEGPVDWKLVQKCFSNQPVTYRVATRGSFIVLSVGAIGFQHRVIEDPSTHHCQNDPTQDVKSTGRVRPGELFDNGLIAFKPLAGTYETLTTLYLINQNSAPKMVLNAADLGATSVLRGVMPVDMRYNRGDQTLYVVDITVRGLMPVSLDPMSAVQSYSIQ